MLTRRQLLRVIDTQRIEAAIAASEQRTSGEIRVSVARLFWGDVRKTAEKGFQRLGMTETRDRNGVLFFIVPSRRRFAVIGDQGIHAKVGDDFWIELSDILSAAFRESRFTDGLVQAIEAVGARLAIHFPPRPDDNPDQLPNTVDFV